MEQTRRLQMQSSTGLYLSKQGKLKDEHCRGSPEKNGVFKDIFSMQMTTGILPEPETPGVPHLNPFVQAEPLKDVRKRGLSPDRDLPVYARCIRALSDKDYHDTVEVEWTRALALWLTLIEGSNMESDVGGYVKLHLLAGNNGLAMETIRDACGVRSQKTVLKRARDLGRYAQWEHGNKRSWWPVYEPNVLQYLRDANKKQQSKSTGKDLLSAFRFFKFILGAHFEMSVFSTVTIGLSKRVLSQRAERKQARPLTVAEVQRLEELVETAPTLLDRYFVGCLLFALYARCWSDLRYVENLEFDILARSHDVYGFVESRTRIHKTGGHEERRAMAMPLVAPLVGISTSAWGCKWKEAMEAIAFDFTKQPLGPICKAVHSSGDFGKRSLTSEVKRLANC